MMSGSPRAVSDGSLLSFSRRGLIGASILAGVSLLLQGHTPYAQWTVYRRRNLFIVVSRTDSAAVRLAEIVAKALAEELPSSHARYTRATDPVRVASLLATEQIDVAVVSSEDAAQMLTGTGDFAAVGPVPVRLLLELGHHVLITLPTFKPAHAFLLTQTLDHVRHRLPISTPPSSSVLLLPVHPGTIAYANGLAIPADEQANR